MMFCQLIYFIFRFQAIFTLSSLEEAIQLSTSLLNASSIVFGFDNFESHYVIKLMKKIAANHANEGKDILLNWGSIFYLNEPKKTLLEETFESHEKNVHARLDRFVLLNRQRLLPMYNLLCIVAK